MMTLREYIEKEIFAIYKTFDVSHGIAHINEVYKHASIIAKLAFSDTAYNDDILYAAAMLHDIGIQYGRKDHHITGAKFVDRIRPTLCEWFTNDDIDIIRRAVLGHRSSCSSEVLDCLYAKVIADSDSMDGFSSIRRLVARVIGSRDQINSPATNIINESYAHIFDKYSTHGYLKIHLKATMHLYAAEINNTRMVADHFDLYEQFAIDEINYRRRGYE